MCLWKKENIGGTWLVLMLLEYKVGAADSWWPDGFESIKYRERRQDSFEKGLDY